MLRSIAITLLTIVAVPLMLSGCGVSSASHSAPQVIDLNRVLAIFDETMKSQQQGDAGSAIAGAATEEPADSAEASGSTGESDSADSTNSASNAAAEQESSETVSGDAVSGDAVQPAENPFASNTPSGATATASANTPATDLDPNATESPQVTAQFLTLFANNLNAARLVTGTIGVEMTQAGSIRGFLDANSNRAWESTETQLFELQFDADSNRIIATQQVAGQTYRRDHRYHSGYHGFFFYHAMRNSMWNRQESYYSSNAASSTATRPNYRSMQMSPSNYHSSAVSHARTTARPSSGSSFSSSRSSSSARGFGGSRSFSGGK